jgi:microcompartment protein CcmK/EutM
VNDALDRITVDNIRCESCGAGRGQWCLTSTGGSTHFLHAVRTHGTRAAWAAGYNAAWTRITEHEEKR